jgi:hypothetical protein
MNWEHPLVEVVEVIIAVWLLDIIFKPRHRGEPHRIS